MCFCKLVLINDTIKGQRYQHVLALGAIVHKGNIENAGFFLMCFMFVVVFRRDLYVI